VLDAERDLHGVGGCEIAGVIKLARPVDHDNANAHPGSPAPGGECWSLPRAQAGARQSRSNITTPTSGSPWYRSMPFRPPSGRSSWRGPQRLQLAIEELQVAVSLTGQGRPRIVTSSASPSSRSSRPGPGTLLIPYTAERKTWQDQRHGEGRLPRCSSPTRRCRLRPGRPASRVGLRVTGTVSNRARPGYLCQRRGTFYDKGGNVVGAPRTRVRREHDQPAALPPSTSCSRSRSQGRKVLARRRAQVVNQGH